MSDSIQSVKMRARLQEIAHERRDTVVDFARKLIAAPSPNPPGDIRAVADVVQQIADAIPGLETERVISEEPIHNLILRLPGGRPGRRIVFNGHLDTFPIGESGKWTANPNGEQIDGTLYGLGVSDMKGGLAASLFAMQCLSEIRADLLGEVVATFAGDEETMGVLGTQYLLENRAHAKGDAMISGDAGSPYVLRCGEKGMIWLTARAMGRSAHAAHAHKGDSAIEKLTAMMADLNSLRDRVIVAPPPVAVAIERAAAISERYSGGGETETLRRITVTYGVFRGGRLSNLVADSAEMSADIRLPIGALVAEIESEIHAIVSRHKNIAVNITRRYEPNWTSPNHFIVEIVGKNCAEYLRAEPAVTIRCGGSDARLYRYAGVPSVVCGLTPHNMGAADEHIAVDELVQLGQIFALSAHDFLAMK